jgi:hypothetical protein
VLTGFVLGRERRVDLEVRRTDIFAEDARIVLESPRGRQVVGRPDVVLLSGQVAGRPDSQVFLGLSPHGSNGYVRLADEMFVVSTGPPSENRDTIVYSLAALPPGTIQWSEHMSEADALLVPGAFEAAGLTGGPEASGLRDAPCRIAELAVETDWEFTGVLFGGDAQASAAYAATLIGAVSEIYTRDFNTRVQIDFIRLWSSSGDPWNQGNTIDQLYQFQDYWNLNMTHVQRHAVHFLSGRALGGGVAYGGGLCYPDYDYALSANINGYFPYPLQHNRFQNWDPFVVSHELGHNFGAPHTHDLTPPVDDCAGGDCSVTPNGTIMSYCHTCPGGMSNIRLEFHTRIINEEVLPFLEYDAPCDLSAEAPVITGQPAGQTVDAGDSVTFVVSASGVEPLGFQWRKDGGDILGAEADLYTIDPVTPADAGGYDVVVTNTCGSQISDMAVLTVISVLGDLDSDGDVDLNDFSIFALCYHGAAVTAPPTGCAPEQFEMSDLDGDNDVDLGDFSTFGNAFTG